MIYLYSKLDDVKRERVVFSTTCLRSRQSRAQLRQCVVLLSVKNNVTGGKDDVEKVGRTSGKIQATHLLKPETEQQESWRNVLNYHLAGFVLSRKR